MTNIDFIQQSLANSPYGYYRRLNKTRHFAHEDCYMVIDSYQDKFDVPVDVAGEIWGNSHRYVDSKIIYTLRPAKTMNMGRSGSFNNKILRSLYFGTNHQTDFFNKDDSYRGVRITVDDKTFIVFPGALYDGGMNCLFRFSVTMSRTAFTELTPTGLTLYINIELYQGNSDMSKFVRNVLIPEFINAAYTARYLGHTVNLKYEKKIILYGEEPEIFKVHSPRPSEFSNSLINEQAAEALPFLAGVSSGVFR